MCVRNFNFAPKFCQNAGLQASKFAFLEINFRTISFFLDKLKFGEEAGQCPFAPLATKLLDLADNRGTDRQADKDEKGFLFRGHNYYHISLINLSNNLTVSATCSNSSGAEWQNQNFLSVVDDIWRKSKRIVTMHFPSVLVFFIVCW